MAILVTIKIWMAGFKVSTNAGSVDFMLDHLSLHIAGL